MSPALLRQTLDAAGWSLAELARRAGRSHTVARRWAAGVSPIPEDVAQRLARTAVAVERVWTRPARRT